MKLKHYIAATLLTLTLLYSALVILNPNNYLGSREEKLFDFAYVKNSYPGKASAIQLIGTTIIALGIITSQNKWNIARITSLIATLFTWIGLIISIDNTALVDTTLAVFLASPMLIAITACIYLLPTIIVKLIYFITVRLVQYIKKNINKWIAWVRRIISVL